eukprot:COSAG06_NODE_1952_length_7992_cov_4.274294_3_plen_78_part_00
MCVVVLAVRVGQVEARARDPSRHWQLDILGRICKDHLLVSAPAYIPLLQLLLLLLLYVTDVHVLGVQRFVWNLSLTR